MGKTILCESTAQGVSDVTIQRDCKVITVSSRKGGIGKTTTTVSLCAGLAGQVITFSSCEAEENETGNIPYRRVPFVAWHHAKQGGNRHSRLLR